MFPKKKIRKQEITTCGFWSMTDLTSQQSTSM